MVLHDHELDMAWDEPEGIPVSKDMESEYGREPNPPEDRSPEWDSTEETLDVEFTTEGEGDLPPWYLPPDRYVFRVSDLERKESKKSAWDYYEFTLEAKHDGKWHRLKHRCTMNPEEGKNWMLKRTLGALGLPHSGKVSIKRSEIIGKLLEAELEDEEYRERIQSKVVGVHLMESDTPDWVAEHPEVAESTPETEREDLPW